MLQREIQGRAGSADRIDAEFILDEVRLFRVSPERLIERLRWVARPNSSTRCIVLARRKAQGVEVAVFEIDGLRCMAVICADFWYASSFCTAAPDPDIVLLPSFSFSQRPIPSMTKARWRHVAIARL